MQVSPVKGITVFDERPPVKPAVYEIAEGIVCLYLGRDVTPPSPVSDIPGNWVDLDWNWGVCSYVFYDGNDAVVFDTGVYPSQGAWIRAFVEQNLKATRILVVNSHWHLDHVSGNVHFADCPIIATTRCRSELAALKEQIESATLWGEPAVPVVLPSITFDDGLHIQLGKRSLHLRRFDLHTEDSIALEVEGEGICLCSDMLEDTVPFVTDFEKIPTFLSELARLRACGCQRFFPCHGSPRVIANGGYGPGFIDAVEEYLHSLQRAASDGSKGLTEIENCIPEALRTGVVSIWEPYRSVHEKNLAGMGKMRGARANG